MEQAEKVRRVVKLLEAEYNSPRHYNKRNPLNEFLFILLSLRTDERVYNNAYRKFKRKYRRWSDVYADTVENIAATIYRCGLARQKAERLKKALEKIMRDFGDLSLKYLKSYDNEQMEKYLLSLPGVGLKMARCIMMFSFAREVLPVDAHTYRISQRIGFLDGGLTESRVHKIMDGIMPKKFRYSYHVNCVAHGRLVCKAAKPNCGSCVVNELCVFKRQSLGRNMIHENNVNEI